MKIIIEKDYKELSEKAAGLVVERLKAKPDLVLGLATGSTPLGLYEELVRRHREERLDFSKVRVFNLDEYCGLSADHPQSYRYFMRENLFSKINAAEENTSIPSCEAPGEEYEQKIKEAGGIDLQVLGIGGNGHIGFNEPGSSFDSRTRMVRLDSRTVKDNARFFDSEAEVPRRAVTMGIGTIMEAREIMLLANGEKKAEIVGKALKGLVSNQVPASVLQGHNNVTIILDEEAGKKLEL